METGAVRQQDSRGRHTTTHRQLFLLQNGAMVIDTPGMRELGMWNVSDGLKEAFADVEAYLGKSEAEKGKRVVVTTCFSYTDTFGF